MKKKKMRPRREKMPLKWRRCHSNKEVEEKGEMQRKRREKRNRIRNKKS